MGFLDKLFGRAKSAGRERDSTGDSGGGRQGTRVTEPARTSGEGTRPTELPDPGRREGAGPESGPR